MWLSHLCLPSCLIIFKLRPLPSYRNWELEVLSLLMITGIPHCVEHHFIVLLRFFFFFFFFNKLEVCINPALEVYVNPALNKSTGVFFFLFLATFAHFISHVSFAILIIFKTFSLLLYFLCWSVMLLLQKSCDLLKAMVMISIFFFFWLAFFINKVLFS